MASALANSGHSAIGIACDVADSASVHAAVARTAEMFGGLDILINTAGLHSLAYNQGFAALGASETQRLFDVNVMGIVHATLAARPLMAARNGGSVINISSIAGYACETAYGVSKLAVRGLTIAFAKELAADGIRVNAIAPGLMATDTIRAELPSALFDEFANKFQLVHRTGEVADIVSAMLYLCGDSASFITGETLKVSGGFPLSI